MRFEACGCTTSSTMPLLLALGALVRRRRTSARE
ncbi:MAG: MYXO-CTERM sorting domain-containing protein [Myxococcaceae bacterium]